MDKKKNLSSFCRLLAGTFLVGASSFASASSLTFQVVPFDGNVTSKIDVANDGSIAFSSPGNGLYEWSPVDGLTQFAQAGTNHVSGYEPAEVSSDGEYVVFQHPSSSSNVPTHYAYRDGVLIDSQYARPLSALNTQNLTGFLSAEKIITGYWGGQTPTAYNLETDERYTLGAYQEGYVFKYNPDTQTSFIRRAEALSTESAFIRFGDGSTAELPGTGVAELPVVSDDGRVFVMNDQVNSGASNGCQLSAWFSTQCAKIYDTATMSVTSEVVALNAKDLSADGSVVVGFGLSAFAGLDRVPAIWDEVNGAREIPSLLEAEGFDLSGLDFSDPNGANRTIVISPDGSKVAGTLVAADGERTPFLIDFGSQEPQPVMIGAFIDGNAWNTGNIDEFNAYSEKDLAFVNFFASMSGRFDWHHSAQMNNIIASGASPMMTLEPRFWNGSVTGQDEIDILKDIAAGEYDYIFRNWVNGYGQSWEIGFKTWIQSQPEGSTIMLRFAHEMNGGWYPWGAQPEHYANAWRHIHDLFEEEGVNQYIQWVWCPDASTVDTSAYYPGDNYVDWTCIDTYNWGSTYAWSRWRSFAEGFSASYEFLTANYPDKPIMLGEFGSYEPADLPSENGDGNGQPGDNSDQFEDKNLWQEEMARDLETLFPAVRAISTFNFGTFKLYGYTLQGNPATGIDGWNTGLSSPHFTSEYFSVK